jgi:hypothetical protein
MAKPTGIHRGRKTSPIRNTARRIVGKPTTQYRVILLLRVELVISMWLMVVCQHGFNVRRTLAISGSRP